MNINKFMTILMVICATHEMHAAKAQPSRNSTARTPSTQPTAPQQTQAQKMREEIDAKKTQATTAEALKSSKTTIAKTSDIVARNKANAAKAKQWSEENSKMKEPSKASNTRPNSVGLKLDPSAQPQNFAQKQQMVQNSLLLEPGKPKLADKGTSQKPVVEKPQERFANRKSLERKQIRTDAIVGELNQFNKLSNPTPQPSQANPAPANKVTSEPVNQSGNTKPTKVKKTLPEKIKEYQDTLVAEYKAIKKKIAELSSEVVTGLKPKQKTVEKEPKAKTTTDEASTPQDSFLTKIKKSSQQSAEGFERLNREIANRVKNPDAIRTETSFENGTHTIKNIFKDTSQGANKGDLFTKEKTFSKDGTVITTTKKEVTAGKGDFLSKTLKTENKQKDGYTTKTQDFRNS